MVESKMRDGVIDELEQNVRKSTNGTSKIDDYIRKDVSLEEMVGAAPKTPTFEFGSFQTQEDIGDFNERFYGTPDREEEVEVKGAIPRFFEKAMDYLLGGTKTVTIEGKKGLYEEGVEIYQSAMKGIVDIKKNIPKADMMVREYERFKKSITEYIDENEFVFDRCESKEELALGYLKDTERLEKYDELTTAERGRVQKLKRGLHNYLDELQTTKRDVSMKINQHYQQEEMMRERSTTYQNQVAEMKSMVSGLEANLEYFRAEVEMLPLQEQVGKTIQNINEAQKNIRKMYVQVNQMVNMNNTNFMKGTGDSTSLIDEGMIASARDTNETFSGAMRNNQQNRYDQTRDIMKKRRERN